MDVGFQNQVIEPRHLRDQPFRIYRVVPEPVSYTHLDVYKRQVSTLKPDEITAYISAYLEQSGVDTSGLTPDGLTAFVLAFIFIIKY